MDGGGGGRPVAVGSGDAAHHAHAAGEEEQRVGQRGRADRGDAEGAQHRGAHMRLGAPIERLHHRAREDFDLLRDGVMKLHLPLECLDRSFARRALSEPPPALRRWSRRASLGRTRSVREAPLDRLDALEPEQAGDFARDHHARAGDAGRDRDGGDRAERCAALERSGDPPIGIDGEPAGDEHPEPGEADRDRAAAARRRLSATAAARTGSDGRRVRCVPSR